MKKCPNCGALMGDLMEKCNSCGRVFPTEDTVDIKPADASGAVSEPEPADVPEAVSEPEPADVPEAVSAPEPADASGAASEPELVIPEPPSDIPEVPESDVPVLELGTDPYVQPPEFPDPPGFEDETPAGQNQAGPAPAPENIPPYGTTPPSGSTAAGSDQPGSAPPPGGHVNQTQQAINRQKEKQQSGYGAYQRRPESTFSSGSSGFVTGTPALIISIIAIVLVVVFGAIGSCTGVGAFSFILTLIGLVLSIIGLVMASRDRKLSGETCDRAKTAFVLSLIALIIGAILLIIGISCVGCIGCLAISAAGGL